jgi:hypothetical protein
MRSVAACPPADGTSCEALLPTSGGRVTSRSHQGLRPAGSRWQPHGAGRSGRNAHSAALPPRAPWTSRSGRNAHSAGPSPRGPLGGQEWQHEGAQPYRTLARSTRQPRKGAAPVRRHFEGLLFWGLLRSSCRDSGDVDSIDQALPGWLGGMFAGQSWPGVGPRGFKSMGRECAGAPPVSGGGLRRRAGSPRCACVRATRCADLRRYARAELRLAQGFEQERVPCGGVGEVGEDLPSRPRV